MKNEHQVLGLMLFLGFIIGIIFIYVVPPWQHYDEPTHFEYVWLIANRDGIPDKGEYDQSMRREVASSMIERGFFIDLGFEPNLISIDEPIWIGMSQTGSNPVYYWLAAIPLRILRTTDILFQLFVVRYVSLIFFMATIVAAYGVAVELTTRNHPLRWLLPTTIFLLPGMVDLMTAINDDVGAIAFFSLFLWSGVRLLVHGFNLWRFFVMLILALICFFTKNTVMIAVVLVLIPVLFSIVQKRYRRFVWFALAGLFSIIVLSLITWGDPSGWYRVGSQHYATRSRSQDEKIGTYVFQFNLNVNNPPAQVFQLFSGVDDNYSTYTIGAWIWADRPAKVQTPILRAGDEFILEEVEVSDTPKFFSVTGELETLGLRPRIILAPGNKSLGTSNKIYYDGIIVLEGDWSGDSQPEFSDETATRGLWGSREFVNLARNPSAENGKLRFRDWIERIISDRFPGNPTLILGLILDPISLGSYYTLTIKSLLQTFWAKFGWAHVILIGYRPYTILGLVTLVGVLGAIIAFWQNRKRIHWDIFIFLGASLAAVWGAAILRGLPSVLEGTIFIPVARYAYPVIIPTMLLLNIGWLEISCWLERSIKISQKISLILLLSFFIALDIISVISIYRFYNYQTG